MIIKNSKIYDALKWLALVCLPAFKIAIPQLFEVWQIPLGTEISKTLDIIAVLLGSLLMVSNMQYTKESNQQVVEQELEEEQ